MKKRFYFSRNTRKSAFTLAEVLITLGIIGVVAAITIPALIANYQKHVTVTKLKSTYAKLQEIIKLSEVDNGPASTWEYGAFGCEDAVEFSKIYILPYVKTIKTCGCDNSGMCNFKATPLNNSQITNATNYYTTRSEKIFLPDGVEIAISRPPGYPYAMFFIDINGNNSPNLLGKDIFEFELWEGRLYPRAASYTREQILSTSNGCSKDSTGDYCSQLIMLDGWKIAPDYPW